MSMTVDKMQSVTKLLEEIKNATACFMKYNEQSQTIIDKLFQNMKQSSPESVNGENENHNKVSNEIPGGKTFEDLDYLENILLEKMQENAKLKALNERLLRNSREKSHKIKELSRTISLQSQRDSMSREVSMYRDKIGKCNVEIQKLKKQLDVETKKLQNEKNKAMRSKNNISIEGYRKSTEIAKKSLSAKKKSFISLEGQRKLIEINKKPPLIKKTAKSNQSTKCSFKELDEILIEKTLVMIKLNSEPSLSDETFDEPKNLNSDSEEEFSGDLCKESSDELLKESTDGDSSVILS